MELKQQPAITTDWWWLDLQKVEKRGVWGFPPGALEWLCPLPQTQILICISHPPPLRACRSLRQCRQDFWTLIQTHSLPAGKEHVSLCVWSYMTLMGFNKVISPEEKWQAYQRRRVHVTVQWNQTQTNHFHCPHMCGLRPHKPLQQGHQLVGIETLISDHSEVGSK